MINKKLLIFIGFVAILLISLPSIIKPVKAETIIYDNFTSSNYKFLSLEDNNNNLPLVGDYKYKILLDIHNGKGYKLMGYYGKDDDIFLPDNSSVIVFVPSPIKTNTSDLWLYNVKPNLITLLGFSITYVPYIIIVAIIIYYVQRKIRKGY